MTKSDWRNVNAWIWLTWDRFVYRTNPWCKARRMHRTIRKLEAKLFPEDE